jgi:hypothetical protein
MYHLVCFLLQKSTADETVQVYERLFEGKRIPNGLVRGFLRLHGVAAAPGWSTYIQKQDLAVADKDKERRAWQMRVERGNVLAEIKRLRKRLEAGLLDEKDKAKLQVVASCGKSIGLGAEVEDIVADIRAEELRVGRERQEEIERECLRAREKTMGEVERFIY